MRPNLTNVTFSGNSASGAGGGMINQSIANPTLTNVVFWGNSDGGSSMDVFTESGTPVITYTCSEQSCAASGNETLDGTANEL